MHCPACNTPLVSESHLGQIADRCPHCQGMWLGAAELGHAVRDRPEVLSADGGPRQPTPIRACPNCLQTMTAINYAQDSGAMINKCESCAGFWLEPGQLDQLARYRTGTPAVRALESAMGDVLYSANRWQRIHNVLRSRWLSGAVAIAYLAAALLLTWDPLALIRLTAFLALPMFCIWFPDAMGNLKGIRLGLWRPTITKSTPGDMVAVGGWLLLLAPSFMFFT